jgi:KaiC/GvpD/RAD55 family RecA-like ATPase
MARKKTSKTALDAEERELAERSTRAEDEKHRSDASKIALLQLGLGRSAQMFGIYSALALALCAILETVSPYPGFVDILILQQHYFTWLIVLIVGVAISASLVIQKWRPYVGHKGSGHFVLTVLALIVSAVMLLLLVLVWAGQLPMPYVAWIYPVSVLPISLTLVSIAATWEGNSRRKVMSIASASVPPIFLLFTLVPSMQPPPIGSLPLAYLFSALTIELSGSLLLITATATEAQEREIVKAGGTHLAILREEYQKRQQAIDYKEKAMRAQESHLDSREQALRGLEDEITEKTEAAEALNIKYEAQWKELKELERQLSVMKVDVQTKAEELDLRKKSFKENEDEVERLKDEIKERELKMLEREKELRRQEIDITEKLRKAEERASAAEESERRLKIEEGAIEKLRNDTIQSEKNIELRESEIHMKIEELEAVLSKDQETKVREIKDWENKVMMKERDLGKLDVELRKLDKDTKTKADDMLRADARLQQQRLQLSDREKDLVIRQKQLSDLEASMTQRAQHMEQQINAVKAERDRLDLKESDYAKLFRSIKETEAAVVSAQEELKRQQGDVGGERQKAKAISENLSSEVKRLNEKNRKLAEREREIEQAQSDMQLRIMELDSREKALSQTPIAGLVDKEREKAIELREKRLREREEELRRRSYQKEKEMEALEISLKEKGRTLAVAAGEEVAPAEEVAATEDKLKTGVARLDDLFFGGLRMNTNVLLVGPAFVGKEVLLYNFVAAGLKKGIPAIIVTTTKPPVEIAKEIAPVLPSFIEYEQLGLVRWIDASGTMPAGSKPTKDGAVYRINGATDFANILDVIDLLDAEFKEKKHPYFRLAYITLSSSTTHTEESKAVGFVQQLVNRLRQTKELSFMTLEKGMHTDQQIETLEHLADGAILFKSEGNKMMFSVAGLGEVQSRDWVRYKATNKTLIIGAFALERIK